MTPYESGEGFLPDDITAVLRVVDGTTADWTLTRRNGKYNLTVRWLTSGTDTRRIKTQVARKRTSKARKDRNNRRLMAFLQKKRQSTTPTEYTTEEKGNTAPPTQDEGEQEQGEEMETIETHSEPDSDESDTDTDSLSSEASLQEDPADPGAEGRSTPSTGSGMETISGPQTPPTTPVRMIEKIVYDLPASYFVLKLEGEEVFYCFSAEKKGRHNIIVRSEHKDFYDNVNRSFQAWPDLRDPKNFLRTEQRIAFVQEVARTANLKFS